MSTQISTCRVCKGCNKVHQSRKAARICKRGGCKAAKKNVVAKKRGPPRKMPYSRPMTRHYKNSTHARAKAMFAQTPNLVQVQNMFTDACMANPLNSSIPDYIPLNLFTESKTPSLIDALHDHHVEDAKIRSEAVTLFPEVPASPTIKNGPIGYPLPPEMALPVPENQGGAPLHEDAFFENKDYVLNGEDYISGIVLA